MKRKKSKLQVDKKIASYWLTYFQKKYEVDDKRFSEWINK